MARQPHQYCLHLRILHEPKIYIIKPHIVFFNNEWHIYRSKWKSQFRSGKWCAACLSDPSIYFLRIQILQSHDGYKYGAHQLRELMRK